MKYVLALLWEISGDRLSSERSTYMYILMHDWIATNTTGSNCLKNRQTCSKSYHLYTTCSKCPRPARTKILDVDEPKRGIKNDWADLNQAIYWSCDWQHDASVYSIRACVRAGRWHFKIRAYDLKYYTFDDFWENNYQSCLYLKCTYKISSLLRWRLNVNKSSKVVLAHI